MKFGITKCLSSVVLCCAIEQGWCCFQNADIEETYRKIEAIKFEIGQKYAEAGKLEKENDSEIEMLQGEKSKYWDEIQMLLEGEKPDQNNKEREEYEKNSKKLIKKL
ncbi:MAG: hypothetical protein LBP31_00305 [Holosporales bacterium]|nr:hypothetical protein [Holosporales bacterium]